MGRRHRNRAEERNEAFLDLFDRMCDTAIAAKPDVDPDKTRCLVMFFCVELADHVKHGRKDDGYGFRHEDPKEYFDDVLDGRPDPFDYGFGPEFRKFASAENVGLVCGYMKTHDASYWRDRIHVREKLVT
jgi:hypothetical protein